MSAAARFVAALPEMGVVADVFRMMEYAEEEIQAAYARFPRRVRSRVRGSFVVLCSSAVLSGRGDRLYRAHVRELIERFVARKDCRPATDAEVLAAILQMSLVAPLARTAQATAERLFARLFPEEGRKVLPEGPDSPSWEGADKEMVSALRKKLTVADRKGG